MNLAELFVSLVLRRDYDRTITRWLNELDGVIVIRVAAEEPINMLTRSRAIAQGADLESYVNNDLSEIIDTVGMQMYDNVGETMTCTLLDPKGKEIDFIKLRISS